MVVAGALLVLPAFSASTYAQEAAQDAAQPQKLTYPTDTVITIYEVNPGKEADYEKVIATLREALAKSTAPEAKEQLATWKVVKTPKPLGNSGAPTYIHIISPVVKDADYNIVQIVYAVSTDDEKRAFYDLYKGALKGALSQMTGNDIATSSSAPSAPAGGQ
jgi:hypothetical protein